MKYIYLILILFAFTNFSLAQKKDKAHFLNLKDTSSFLITTEGEKKICYGNMKMAHTYISYYEKSGKPVSTSHKKIKMMVRGGRLFFNLNKRLQEVYAFNDKYIMTGYWNESTISVYIWDREFNNIEEKIHISKFEHKKQIKINNERFNKSIVKYFSQCDELLGLMRKNINASEYINEGISYYNCGNSPDLLK